MGPVVTIMVGRLDDWMRDVVARDGVDIDPAYLQWAGVAAFKRAYEIFVERGFRARLLSAAFRTTLHWSEFVGGDVVISPPFGWQEKIQASGVAATPRMHLPVDADILAALQRIPDFQRAYEPDGMTPADFDTFGATRKTLRQFLGADEELDHLVRDILVPAPDLEGDHRHERDDPAHRGAGRRAIPRPAVRRTRRRAAPPRHRDLRHLRPRQCLWRRTGPAPGPGRLRGVRADDPLTAGHLPYYLIRNEQSGVHAATAFARAKNRLQVMAVTTSIGPGATNMVTGAALATTNRIPVLLLPSDQFANRFP